MITEQPAIQAQTAEIAGIEIPDRPIVAPGVQLVGEMQGTSFTEQQWLIERGGQFVQVTELLYRVAENADGTRTLDEIARVVTESTAWLVTGENVRQIIELKLIPLGIIASGDMTSSSRPAPSAEDLMQAALAVNMRMKVIGPNVLEPITNVLKVLYVPPVLALMLVAIVVAHGWLFLNNLSNIVTGVLQVLYTPGLMVVVLAIVLASAFFHEFGHGAALRYGGGHVRGMGFGLYLIYPAFYTDVTDGYRLGRWARVRTDLGGVYFHLIFSLALIGLYFLTGQHFLLLAVVVICSEVVRQFIPFVRLDGYWLLADLTGVPDFFSQMVPFMRSILPVPWLKGDRLPNLKPWVKAIFVLFIVLTIPALVFLFFVMLLSLPVLLMTTWDSLLAQFEALGAAYSAGDIPLIVLLLLQMFLLALPIIGTFYLLYIVGRAGARALWSWSKPTTWRRLLGTAIAAGVVALVAFVWVPQLVAAGQLGPPGVERYRIEGRSHAETPVSYAQTPPVGGDHAPEWQNCGFYDKPIRNEHGVHSLEHGAVWITYRPNLPSREVEFLRRLVGSQTHLLASPYPELPAPVVVSAWGRQLRLTSTDDPRLERFVKAFRLSNQAPESGGPCTDGVGTPK